MLYLNIMILVPEVVALRDIVTRRAVFERLLERPETKHLT